MPRVLLAICATLALVVTGLLLPVGHERLDARAMQAAPSAHRLPWPAWAHTAPAVSAAPTQQPSTDTAAAAPAGAEKQSHETATDRAVIAGAATAPAWLLQPIWFSQTLLHGQALLVLTPPPRTA